jgi:hypothetical protein
MSGCAMTQVLRCWPLNAYAPVQSRVTPCTLVLDKVAEGKVFHRQRHSANAAYLYSSRYCSYHKDKDKDKNQCPFKIGENCTEKYLVFNGIYTRLLLKAQYCSKILTGNDCHNVNRWAFSIYSLNKTSDHLTTLPPTSTFLPTSCC